MRLRALLAGSALGAALLAPAVTAGAAAAPASSCSSTSGVLVVVDLRHFGGSLTRGCDPSPSTGYDALHAAGYTTEGTRHDGPAFVCRIDGYPTPQQQACVNTPPANAYWSYWHAAAGQNRWTYSSRGAQSTHPDAGSVDAWVFGATDVAGTSGGPAFTPAEARGRTAGAPSAHTTRAPGGSSIRTSPGTPRHTTGPTRAAGSGRPAPAQSSPARSASTSATAGTSTHPGGTAATSSGAAATSAGTPSFAEASSVARASASGGSPWPVVLGVALVLLLGAGGGWGVLRRRRADAADH